MENGKKMFTWLTVIVSKVWSAIYYTLLTASVIILVGFVMDLANGGVGSVYGYKPIIIQTGSMTPAIAEKSLIIGKEVDPETIEVGDIVTFEIEEENRLKMITHRVIEVDKVHNTLQTKGDANGSEDLFDQTLYPNGLPFENVVYRVDIIVNQVAPLLFTLSSSYKAPILAVIIIAGLVMIWKLLKDMFYDPQYDPRYKKLHKNREGERTQDNDTELLMSAESKETTQTEVYEFSTSGFKQSESEEHEEKATLEKPTDTHAPKRARLKGKSRKLKKVRSKVMEAKANELRLTNRNTQAAAQHAAWQEQVRNRKRNTDETDNRNKIK